MHYDWKIFPIIHLNLASDDSKTAEELEHSLNHYVIEIAEQYKIKLPSDKARICFSSLIKNLYEKIGPVAILIDEYDKLILNNISNSNIDELQQVMKSFYSVLKACEEYEHFVFITGVGKFLKTSIFSMPLCVVIQNQS